jgi:hypothetical protein
MPQVDITLLFVIVQTFSIVFFIAYFIFLTLLSNIVDNYKLKNKLIQYTVHLTKLINIRTRELSVFNSLKQLKLID